MRFTPALLAVFVTLPLTARADEGMWLLNDFPTEKTKALGFTPDQAWLDDVRLASVRLAGGCSASVVSEQGLVLTNHHCAARCVAQLSTKKKDLAANGFYAKRPQDEKQCPAMELNQLTNIESVTARINGATKGLEGAAFKEARDKEIAAIEKACATSDAVRCDVVTLYHGGRYDLYTYRRMQDVRLVFAPEEDIAYFGGDPDNFNFPRYNLDMTLLRIYEDGKPAKTPNHFRWSKAGSSANDLVFVSGNPGRTSRGNTVAELEYLRDVYLPDRIFWLAELRGQLTVFARSSKEHHRISKTDLLYVENGYKALKGRLGALLDKDFFASKVEAEKKLRAKVDADPKLAAYRGAWTEIDKALRVARNLRTEYNAKEARGTFGSSMMGHARTLVRWAAEKDKPNGERLPEYTDSKLPALKARLLSKAPIYPDLEELKIALYLTKLREELGPDDPFVKKVLGKDSPEKLAKKLVKSKLVRPALRKKLFEGGAAAVAKSKDPMIVLARVIDADGRAVREKYETQVESVIDKNTERVANARFAALGTSTYPDATFTLRLSYGQVKGFDHHGAPVKPYTTIAGAFGRATGEVPFKLPKSFTKNKGKIDLSTPMNLVTTNDIIGGNSGSPLFNAKREIVGLIFDGNIYSLGGDYGFDPSVNRAVAVDSRFMVEALRNVYGAKRLLTELGHTP
ncbi:MAG: S46 family peptidase [Deltaproteobacteria bacterium]|jgi:hypothetical protein